MPLTVEAVDPRGFAAEAGAVLREAWGPSGILYTAEYLGWQFGSPGGPGPLAAAAFDGGDPVGFAAAVPRRLRHAGGPVPALVLSFVAVSPGHRGRGVAAAVYAALLAAAAPTGLPVLAYAQPGTPGRHALLRAFGAAGYRRADLGLYRTYAHRPGPAPAADGLSCGEVGPGEFLEAAGRCDAPRTLWSDPDPARMEHYRADPRGRALAVARGPGGEPLGAGMVVLCETATPRGVERVALLDSAFLPDPRAGTLGALLRFAAGRWPDRVSTPTVSAPSLWGLDAELLRAAGARATPSAFEGYLFTAGGGAGPGVDGTNLEII